MLESQNAGERERRGVSTFCVKRGMKRAWERDYSYRIQLNIRLSCVSSRLTVGPIPFVGVEVRPSVGGASAVPRFDHGPGLQNHVVLAVVFGLQVDVCGSEHRVLHSEADIRDVPPSNLSGAFARHGRIQLRRAAHRVIGREFRVAASAARARPQEVGHVAFVHATNGAPDGGGLPVAASKHVALDDRLDTAVCAVLEQHSFVFGHADHIRDGRRGGNAAGESVGHLEPTAAVAAVVIAFEVPSLARGVGEQGLGGDVDLVSFTVVAFDIRDLVRVALGGLSLRDVVVALPCDAQGVPGTYFDLKEPVSDIVDGADDGAR